MGSLPCDVKKNAALKSLTTLEELANYAACGANVCEAKSGALWTAAWQAYYNAYNYLYMNGSGDSNTVFGTASIMLMGADAAADKAYKSSGSSGTHPVVAAGGTKPTPSSPAAGRDLSESGFGGKWWMFIPFGLLAWWAMGGKKSRKGRRSRRRR